MLPIESILPELRAALGEGRSAVLQAAPGAGKTTGVPPALLAERWLEGQRIVMLEPRRLATRAAARRMAQLLGEPVGETAGFRVRGESRVGRRTRIEVVTEGILTRIVQRDPSLEGIGIVIFDEYHERSLDADLALALTLEARDVLRPDLRVLVMSATLDGERVARLLGDARVITSEGRVYPVETRYIEWRTEMRIEDAVAAVVRRTLRDDAGDVLAFLPGTGEIRRTYDLLLAGALPPGTQVFSLHGTLSPEDQDRAILPSAPGERKVVLATSIAETSLTIEGVRVVIDSGLTRVPKFSPRTGMTRLDTVRVSRASADQRRGRAGRLASGVCYRLWPEHEQHHLLAHSTPEILEADLAPVALELAAAGATDPAALRWLDVPPPAAYSQARELLRELGALETGNREPRTANRFSRIGNRAETGTRELDESGDSSYRRITPHGRRMLDLPLHPRLAHMVLAAESLGATQLACDVAALLSERDPLRANSGEPLDADIEIRLALLRRDVRGDAEPGRRVDGDALRRIRRESERLNELLTASRRTERSRVSRNDSVGVGLLIAFAYPDRIAQLRAPGSGRFLLRNGNGAALASAQTLSDSPYIAVAELDGRRPESRIFLAASISLEEIEAHFGDQIVTDQTVEWNAAQRAVVTREVERLGAIVLVDRPVRTPDAARVTDVLLEAIAKEGVEALPWTDRATSLRQRLAFLRRLDSSWPDVSDAALTSTLGTWLGPHLAGARSIADVGRVDLASALLAGLPWDRRAAIDELAPTHMVVPTGSRIPIDYADPDAPVLAVRLQEMFGLADTPRIAGGAVPLTIHLLSPAHRPVQVTRDLGGFWRGSYFEVRKELRGRYPKHYWPDDPLMAEPTMRAKRRKE